MTRGECGSDQPTVRDAADRRVANAGRVEHVGDLLDIAPDTG